MCCLL
jgi:hypothetical protein